MAVFIPSEIFAAFETTYRVLFALALLSLPGLVILLSPFFYCCHVCRSRGTQYKGHHHYSYVTDIAENIVFFLKKEKKEGEKYPHFVVYNYKAPTWYADFLVFSFIILMLHALLAFWSATIEVLPNAICHDLDISWLFGTFIPTSFNSSDYYDEDLFCIEFNILNGLESVVSILSFSVVAMALVTGLLLFLTEGSKIHERKTPCLLCRVGIAVLLQIFGLVVLRVAVFTYLMVNINVYYSSTGPTGFGGSRTGGLIDLKSFFAVAAICDSISLSCLTLWTYFEKNDKGNEKRNAITNASCPPY